MSNWQERLTVEIASERSEEALVRRCLIGDGQAWNELFDHHYSVISSIAAWKKWRLDAHELEDVVQEILAEVVRSLKRFEFKSSLGTFIHSIAVNTCIAHLRKKKAVKRKLDGLDLPLDTVASSGEQTAGLALKNPAKNQEAMLVERETLVALREAILGLEEHCKELIKLRYFDELSFQDMAKSTGAKPNTLVVQLRRCLARLVNMLKVDI